MNKLYSNDEISFILRKKIKAIYNAVWKLQLKPEKIISGKHYYSYDQMTQIENELLRFSDVKFYPIRTTETYYIYESKMNKL